MNKYGIWNAIEGTQEVNNITELTRLYSRRNLKLLGWVVKAPNL